VEKSVIEKKMGFILEILFCFFSNPLQSRYCKTGKRTKRVYAKTNEADLTE
jgi:hypothetical protein